MTKEEIMQDLVYRQNNIDKIKQLEEDIKDGMYDDNHLIDLVLYYKNEIELLEKEKENMADNYTKYIEERDSKIDKTIEKLSFIDESIEKGNLNIFLCITKINKALEILRGSGVDE